MAHRLKNAVWELTYACNMRCKHCGSGCGDKYPDELSREEALALCDDLGALGLKVITLSGGEPFLHNDWHLLAQRLRDNKIIVNAISNGWFIDEELLDKALAAGIVNIGVSLDGLEATHDFMRRPGSYRRVLDALDVMNRKGMPTVVCTSINKRNLVELRELNKIIREKRVGRWQFQIASPMGNLLEHRELIIDPEDVDELIDLSYEFAREGHVSIDLADDIGYYNTKIAEIARLNTRDENTIALWAGCNAGKCVIGIRANGDITGCLSIRDPDFIEDNIRKRPLAEIWNDPAAFSWNRNLTVEQLQGFCARCQYRKYCLGGCTGAKITLSHNLYENKYCSYRNTIVAEEKRAASLTDVEELLSMARNLLPEEGYQVADIYLERALNISPENSEVLNLLGLVNFMLDNYTVARDYCLKALELNPHDAYAHKGLGLATARLGDVEGGLAELRRAIELADMNFMDPYYDCAVVLYEHGRLDEAIRVLEAGRDLSDEFTINSEPLYSKLFLLAASQS